MLQKIVLVIVSVFSMLASSLAPGVFSPEAPEDEAARAIDAVHEAFFTQSYSGDSFARVSVLSLEVDGRVVTEDAWGQGTLKELRFTVGVKKAEGNKLVLGDEPIPLRPTDTLTINNFRGRFAFKDVTTASATIALDGTVETTRVAQGELVNKVTTQQLAADAPQRASALESKKVDVAYVTLDIGKKRETVTWETGGSARLYTWQPEQDAPDAEAQSILTKWLKIDGKPITQYAWGEGRVSRIAFEPTEKQTLGTLVNWSGTEHALTPRKTVVIENFVGSYVAHESLGGGMKLRLDGYAQTFKVDVPNATAPGENLAPRARIGYTPEHPTTSDYVTFQDLSVDDDGLVVFREWRFGDNNQTSILPAPKRKFTESGVWPVELTVTDNGLATGTTTVFVTVTNTPPVADWDFRPHDVYAAEVVRFEDKSWDPDDVNGPVSFSWDLGDASALRTDATFTHTYLRHGNYTVTLTVTDADGATNSLSKVVIVKNRPPLPSFEFEPTNPLSMTLVNFTDTSIDTDGILTCWEWDFGDGTQSVIQHPQKTYATPGTFFVNLTVCDDGGGRSSAGSSLSVGNRDPTAAFSFSPPSAISTSTNVQFTDLSTDIDGNVVEWRWNFGDGSPVDTRRNPAHRFFRSGTYTTCLTVTDDRGATGTTCDSVGVDNSAPAVTFTWTPRASAAPLTNQSIAFTDQSTDPDGDTLTAWSWDFGDGSPVDTARHPTHKYPTRGQYLVTLTVTDNKGKTGTHAQSLTVHNRLPVVSFNNTPALPTTLDTVTFEANASDIDGTIISLVWDFGDGSPPTTGTVVTHNYPTAGDYRVSLTATDNDGGVRTVGRDIHVSLPSPQVNFTWSPQFPAPGPGDRVDFTDTTVANGVTLVNWSWTFGDGASSSRQHPNHTYAGANLYPVRLTVRDGDGNTYSEQKNVRINGDPTASFTVNRTNVPLGGSVRVTDTSVDPDGTIVDWQWDFGDGSGLVSGKGPHDHVYSVPGSHTIRLVIRDMDGATAEAALIVNVANRAPNAEFSITPSRPVRGAPAQFTDESTDPDAPHDTIESWSWAFGEAGGTSTVQHPMYTYQSSGIKTVRLQVSDGTDSDAETRLVRVVSDHDLVSRICSRLPDGRLLDHALPDVELEATLDLPTGFGADLALTKASSQVSVDVAGCLEIRLPGIEWAEGDRLSFTVTYHGGGVQDSGFLEPQDHHGTVNSTLRLAIPLDPKVTVQPGSTPPLTVGLLNLGLDLRDPSATYRYPTYTNQSEAVRVNGSVKWRDGAVAANVDAHVMIRYILLRPLQIEPEIINNPVTGWCQAAKAKTDANGKFDAKLRFLPHCISLFNEEGLFLPGWYQVRVVAQCTTCDPEATAGTSNTALFYEDPLGLITGRIGTPDPL